MKKYLKLLLILVLCFAINVKADLSSTGIIPNYTTVYKGDTITFSLGNDYLWDEGFVISDYDEDTDTYEYQKTAEDNYMAEPVFIIIDSDVFELDISENKVPNDNYIFEDYKKTTSGDKTVYEFNFELKKLKDEENGAYDGKIDNILVSNLKLKVKDDAEAGTYFVETMRTTDFEEDYYGESNVIEKMPITIIEKENNNDPLFFTLRTKSNGLVKSSDYDVKLDNKVNEYLYYGEVLYSNISCNTKCLVKGIGSDVYYDDEAENLKYTIKYEDGKEDTVVVKNKLDAASIKYRWADDFAKAIIIVDSGTLKDYNELVNQIASSISYYKDGFESYYYNYNKLNDVDKKILSNLNIEFDNLDEPYIFVVDDGNLVYSHHGNLTEEETNNIQEEIDKNRTQYNSVDQSKISSCDDGTCQVNKDENLDIIALISNNYMYVVIGLSVLIVLLILIITIIKKGKQKNN